MPEYLAPGVYVEEVSSGIKPIEGVSTSVAGFVGPTERGPTNPRLVTSWTDFVRWYGSLLPVTETYTPFAVRGFFDNGGKQAFIARVTRPNAVSASLPLATAASDLTLRARGEGEWGNTVFVRVEAGTRRGFRLKILFYREAPPLPVVDPLDPQQASDPNRRDPDYFEDFDNLSSDPNGSNYVLRVLDGNSTLVTATWADPAAPGDPSVADYAPLAGATAGDAVNTEMYVGDPADPPDRRRGLRGLETIDEVALLCVPDDVHTAIPAVTRGAIREQTVQQCERLADRFAILSVDAGEGNVQAINPAGNRPSSYAGIYYPWVRVSDPGTSEVVDVPSSGHVTGIYARTDIERGVHKAPANAIVRGILTTDLADGRTPLEFRINRQEHAILNPRGVNVIRDFRGDGRGIRVWGARTMSDDPEWNYVNVRRLFLFLEESIEEGTQWVVFEPNHEPTWAKVVRNITNFLMTVWRNGALEGVTPEEAFYVKCDRSTMTEDDINNGRLICLIGVAPVKPAEFVIFRISQKTREATG